MSNQIKDGVDHINTNYRYAATELGKKLSALYDFKFIHPVLGPFGSIEGYWKFLTTGCADDSFRTRPAKSLHRLSKQYDKVQVDDFFELIAHGLYHRIEQDVDLRIALIDTKLDFAYYSIFKGEAGAVVINEPRMAFYIDALETIRECFVSNVEYPTPDYTKILAQTKEQN